MKIKELVDFPDYLLIRKELAGEFAFISDADAPSDENGRPMMNHALSSANKRSQIAGGQLSGLKDTDPQPSPPNPE